MQLEQLKTHRGLDVGGGAASLTTLGDWPLKLAATVSFDSIDSCLGLQSSANRLRRIDVVRKRASRRVARCASGQAVDRAAVVRER